MTIEIEDIHVNLGVLHESLTSGAWTSSDTVVQTKNFLCFEASRLINHVSSLIRDTIADYMTDVRPAKRAFLESRFAARKDLLYFENVAKHIEHFAGSKVIVVEVGVAHGGSIEMLARLLGSQATIIGIDVRLPNIDLKFWDDLHHVEGAGKVFLIQGDSCLPSTWDALRAQFGRPDIVIDDGGHTNHQQLASMTWSILHARHLAIVEDIAASWSQRFGNPHRYSFINWIYGIYRHLNESWVLNVGNTTAARTSEAWSRISSIELFPNTVVIHLADTELPTWTVLQNNGESSQQSGDVLPSFSSRFLSPSLVANCLNRIQKVGSFQRCMWLASVALGYLRWLGNWRLGFFSSLNQTAIF